MVKKSNVEKAAAVWFLLDDKARKMPDGPEKKTVESARRNALRTLATAVKAANAHELVGATEDYQKER
jgi:hypothetical protein